MSVASAILIIGAVAVQLAVGRLMPSAWLTPDLALAALVLISARDPARALGPLALLALLASIGTMRRPWLAVCGYLAAAAALHAAAARWDVTDRVVQMAIVAVAEAALAMMWLTQAGRVPLVVLAYAAGRVALTVACLPLLRPLVWMAVPDPRA